MFKVWKFEVGDEADNVDVEARLTKVEVAAALQILPNI